MYGILQRMLDEGWLTDGWEEQAQAGKAKRPPRRYYELTDPGRIELGALIAEARQTPGSGRSPCSSDRRDLHLMDALIFHVISWPTLGCALLVYGFAPGALLRLIVVLYPRDHPRRRELIGEPAHPRIMRPFWVAEQLETALFEGLHGRLAAWRASSICATCEPARS